MLFMHIQCTTSQLWCCADLRTQGSIKMSPCLHHLLPTWPAKRLESESGHHLLESPNSSWVVQKLLAILVHIMIHCCLLILNHGRDTPLNLLYFTLNLCQWSDELSFLIKRGLPGLNKLEGRSTGWTLWNKRQHVRGCQSTNVCPQIGGFVEASIR